MTRWRWILVAQLAALPLVALALWLHGREQTVPQGSEVHDPAPAATIQPIPPEEPLPAQPVVAWTPKDDFDPMHVQNLDVVNPARVRKIAALKEAVAKGAEAGDELVAAIDELWRAFKAGNQSAVDAILKRERGVFRLGYEIVDVDATGVRLKSLSGRTGRFHPDGEPHSSEVQVEPMPFGAHPFGPWDIGRDNPDG